MSINQVVFTSNTDMWATPQDFFNMLNDEFHFTLDVCAVEDNAKCDKYYTPDDDGLEQPWSGTCWMNPPYGKTIGKWLQKAYEESLKPNTTVVCLIPARTDTKWWHDYCMKGEIRLLRGRLKFGDAKAPAPFPSAVVVFYGDRMARIQALEQANGGCSCTTATNTK